MSNVSLERYYFVLYDGALTLKMSKMALNAFCDKILHILKQITFLKCICVVLFQHARDFALFPYRVVIRVLSYFFFLYIIPLFLFTEYYTIWIWK